MIVNLSGPGGAGKTTLAEALQCDDPLHYKMLVTCTNRPMRAGESDGRHYHFVPAETLADDNKYTLRRIRGNDVYAVQKSDLRAETQVLLTTFPPRGVIKLAQAGYCPMCFYLKLGENERVRRMIERGDRPELIAKRLELDAQESSLASVRAILSTGEFFILDARKPISNLVDEVEGIVCKCWK